VTDTATERRFEPLDYPATLGKLTDLVGREVLVELRVGDIRGPFRLAARGALVGSPPGQSNLTGRRAPGDDLEAFMLDTGGFFAISEDHFVHGEWHAGIDEDQFSAQPRLNIVFTDSVLHVAVLWRHDATTPTADAFRQTAQRTITSHPDDRQRDDAQDAARAENEGYPL
jgi:hypothetical protein